MLIFFCGGGSGGHVIPALTLIKEIKEKNDQLEIRYIGSKTGIESRLIPENNINYCAISTGKLRRYLSFENIIDLFKVAKGIIDSLFMLGSKRNQIRFIFLTGGFVVVPVSLAAFLLGIPIYIHEQTSRVGLANKIASFFAKKVMISFESSRDYFPSHKTLFTGYPLRKACYKTELDYCEFQGMNLLNPVKPILFVTGGGNGSELINNLVEDGLEQLLERFTVIHQVGKNNISKYSQISKEGYYPVEFVGAEMIDLMKAARVILSRAGAGMVCELLVLNKPSIFVPLKIAQKNEQYFNAMEAQKKLNSVVIQEDELSFDTLMSGIEKIMSLKIKGPQEIELRSADKIIKELEIETIA